MSRTPASKPSSTPLSVDPDANPSTAADMRTPRTAFLDQELERIVQVTTTEIRNEGNRWKSLLEGLGLTIQGVAEDLTTVHGASLIETLRQLIDRVEVLESRLDGLVQAGIPFPTDASQMSNPSLPQINVNAKGILQERCIINDLAIATYNIVQTSGTPDSPVFCSACQIPERQLNETGMGRTIRASHQAAAFAMLHRLNWPVEFPSSEERDEFRARREHTEEMEA